MTQQPFTRPGAFDLSSLKRPAAPAPSSAPAGAPGRAGGGARRGSSYAVQVTEENFQATIEASMGAPVLLVFYSRTRMPESGTLADDIETLSPSSRAASWPASSTSTPPRASRRRCRSRRSRSWSSVLDGRPMPLLQDVVPITELRTALTQVLQQLTTQGITGRHQPRTGAPVAEVEGDEEPGVDPRYAAAEDAMGAGDVDVAVAEYQKLVDANPADVEAAAGLTMAKLLQRTQGVDLEQARATAAERPDDVDAQTMMADLDMLDGQVEDAFNRLIELVRRSSGDERNAARQHLIGLFGAVGTDDARVLKARQNLANALF